MSVDLVIEDPRWQSAELDRLAEQAAHAVYDDLDLQGFEVAILACNDDRIAALNADFRGKPRPTNVLSWPSVERASQSAGGVPAAPDPVDPELGDIAISFDTCSAEAAASGVSLGDHATHLVVHGILHLLGYDHERDADATLMEGIETRILGKMGISDPYRG